MGVGVAVGGMGVGVAIGGMGVGVAVGVGVGVGVGSAQAGSRSATSITKVTTAITQFLFFNLPSFAISLNFKSLFDLLFIYIVDLLSMC